MGLFDFGSKGKIKALSNQLADLQNLLNQRLNTITHYPTYHAAANSTRYCTTDDVYSIVSLIASAAAQIEVYNVIKQGDEYIDAPENDELSLLVEQPFEGMTKYESIFAVVATKLIHGEYIIYKFKPELGPNTGKIKSLHLLEPENVNIKVSTTWPFKIVAYQYTVNGQIIYDDIPVEDIIHSKYFNPKIGVYGTELRGLSPLKVLTNRLTRIDSNMDVATAQLQNGGIPGIVYEKGPADDVVDVIGQRKKKFYEYLSNSSNKGAPYFAGGDMGYLQLGLKLADMETAALATIDFKKLCNAYRVSDRLFNNDATGSEISDKGARAGLYTNAVIPEVMGFCDSLNKYLVPEFKGKKYCIKYDISDISELQANYSDMVAWLEKAWWLTPNEKREFMEWEAVTEPLFDQFLIPSGLQTVEDLTMVDPLDNPGDYELNNNE